MNKKHIVWIKELSHKYNAKLDSITERDIDNFIAQRDRMLLQSVITYKYETYYKLIARARKKKDSIVKEQAQCNQIFDLLHV